MSTTVATFRIDQRFRGPPASGNGGYVCGRLAEFFDGDCRVRLLRPPPLDRELTVVSIDDALTLMDGDREIARARPHDLRAATGLSAPPSLDEARACSRRYRGFEDHAFSGCFVCGPDREPGDGLRIFPGTETGADGRVASPWRPDVTLAGADGTVRTRFVWAALDCPSGWAWLHPGGRVAVLGEFAAHVDKPVPSETDLVVVGWRVGDPDDSPSRKHRTASALYTAGGTPLAWAEATWIDVDPASLAA